MNYLKRISILGLSCLILLAGCNANNGGNSTGGRSDAPKGNFSNSTNPIATIIMAEGDVISVELYPEVAPNSVANFITLANEGFYDGIIFHRVIPGFMIQGGDPTGTGMGAPDYSIAGEFTSNGFENNLKHTHGVISMARSQDANSAGSQFFIMVADAPHLDKDYAGFGMVISGLENADKIAEVDRDSGDKPLEEQRIQSIRVDTKGQSFTVEKM